MKLPFPAQLKKHRLFPALLLLLLLAALFVPVRNFWFTPIADDVSVGGVDVSGLTRPKARKVLKQTLEATLYRESLSIQLPQETLELSPETSRVRISLSKALDAACSAAAPAEISLLPYLQVDRSAVYSLLEQYAARYDTELTQPVWQAEGALPPLSTDRYDPKNPCPALVLTMGLPECHLDTDAVYEQILTAMSRAVSLCPENRYRIAPQVTPEALPEMPNVIDICRQLRTEPVNDRPDPDTFGLIPGSYGLAPDKLALRRKLLSAAPGETITVPFVYLAPEVLGEEAFFQDILGAYETKHTSNENRNTNLRLLCGALDGVVLEPGEVFSFNETVGERSKERGYLPAPAYSGNRLVDSYGGGVCQGSTTLYNCVLLSDLEVVFRACHGAKVTYVPYGLDASVNYLTTDFQFRNSANFPIRLQAEVSDGYVRMKIFGTDEKDYYIKMETRTGEDELAYYSRSYKCKYDKKTNELLSREIEAYSTYYKAIG
ncbi:MAG: VanW family protein [Oscillospiraceae bacterium]|nr:VanW family protein [Oscillospiraceae bacterium]